MRSRIPNFIAVVVLALSPLSAFAATAAAAPTTQQQSDLAKISSQTWEQDSARLKEDVNRLNAQLAELEKRKPPATRPVPTTAPAAATSRPASALMTENRHLVTVVNGLYERIAHANNKPSIIPGVSEININFETQNHTIDEVSDTLGMSGQLMAEKEGKLTYEWLFKIQGGNNRIMELQPFACDVVDGKVVANRMEERRKLGTKGIPIAPPSITGGR